MKKDYRISKRKKGYALEYFYERPVWVGGTFEGGYITKAGWNVVGHYRWKWLALVNHKVAAAIVKFIERFGNDGSTATD